MRTEKYRKCSLSTRTMFNQIGIYLGIFFLLLLQRFQICFGICNAMISYGDPKGVPILHRWYLTGDIQEGYNVWKTEDQSLYLFAYKDLVYDEYLWVIADQIIEGTWLVYTLLQKEDPIFPIDYAFFDNIDFTFLDQFKFTCEDDIYNVDNILIIDGYCEEWVMSDQMVSTEEHQISECLTYCQETSGCSAFTYTDHSCVVHTKGCWEPALEDPGYGSRHYTWSYVGVEDLDTAYQSSVGWEGEAIKAIDHHFGGDYFSQLTCISTLREVHPWWAVELKSPHMVSGVVIEVRSDCCFNNLDGVIVGLGTGDLAQELNTFNNGQLESLETCTAINYDFVRTKRWLFFCDEGIQMADYIVLYQPSDKITFLSFCELEVIASPATKYTVIDKRLTQEDGDVMCSSKLAGKGQLARATTKEEFDLMSEELVKHPTVDIVWTGHEGSDSLHKEFWFPNVTRRLMNVYIYDGQCFSTAVSSSLNCDLAFDGNTDYTSSWIYEGSYATAWLKIELRYPYTLYAINLMQTFCSCASIKEIELTFSDLTSQKLQQRHGTSYSDTAGQDWDVLSLNGVMTKSILLVILSVYDTYTTEGGIVEIQLIGEDYGVDIRNGLCQGHYIQTLYKDFVSCYVTCRNTETCESLSYAYKGVDFDTCILNNAVCSESEMTLNDDVLTLNLKGFEGLYTLRYGTDKMCVITGFFVAGIFQDCMNYADAIVGSIGFSITAHQYNLCSIHCAKSSTGYATTDVDKYIFFEKLANVASNPDIVPPAAANNYVGCYHEWELSADQYNSGVQVIDPVSNLASDCITFCLSHGYDYAALQARDCMCRAALGQQVDGCYGQCYGDNSVLERCGYAEQDEWTVYTTVPELSTECIQLSKKPLDTVQNHHPWMADTGHSKMQTNLCDTEYPLMCENTAFDFCERLPCHNDGTCEASTTDYLCHCLQGYTGVHCETDIDECTALTDSCYNGAECVNVPGSFNCVCLLGFTGDRCHIDINDCVDQPCLNNGICEDQVNSYFCDCNPGYTGQNCETDINECDSQPCKNGGNCQNNANSFACGCMAGYEGVLCERNIDECSSDPCINGGTCVDRLNQYECSCVIGYTGGFCETDINECSSSPCQNGATCLDLQNKFECGCATGFDGIYCENDINECWSGPCENNAPCLDLIDNYRCECLAGFGGDHCEAYIGNPGDWSEWGAWGECSTSCDQGVTYRSRDCIPQFPELGGGICGGSDSDSQACLVESCGPISGQWSPWSPTSDCSSVCGPGIVSAGRLCNAPKPSNGGPDCTGENSTMLLCENTQCLNRRVCGEWSEWTSCTGSCTGGGHRDRQRACNTGDVSGMESVIQPEEQTQTCQPQGCSSQDWECSVCTSSKSPNSVSDVNCAKKQTCPTGTNTCSTTYGLLSDGNIKLTKGCKHQSDCQPLSERDSYCKRLAALGVLNGQSVNGTSVHEVVLTDILRLWVSLQGSCTICCNYQNCNADLLPPWDSLTPEN